MVSMCFTLVILDFMKVILLLFTLFHFSTLVSLCVYRQTVVFNFSHFSSFCGRSLSLKSAFGSIFVVFATLIFFLLSTLHLIFVGSRLFAALSESLCKSIQQ